MRFHEGTTMTPPAKKPAEPDCTCEEPKKKVCCCKTDCFVRPNYFCGHLLTDADLSLGQKYVIEKQKLYHRSLHGSGVVCGLRLTCDHDCEGYVRVGDGFAIDDCGNDLVVCEPAHVNVIGELKRKGWLLEKPAPDPCDDEPPPEECEPRQCYYIAVCYEEQPSDFTTPFRSGCGGGPAACEPTRVHENVRFEILDELPNRPGAIAKMHERVRHCYAIFSEGALGRKLAEHRDLFMGVMGAAKPGGSATTNNADEDVCRALCEIRVLFLQYLKVHPDEYNCDTERLVREIRCPDPKTANDFEAEAREAVSSLFERMMRYAWDCELNELAFPCDEPCCASCVILGTVEVERGRIVRVCNVPREYVWSPAHFFPVMFFTSMTARYNAATTREMVYESMLGRSEQMDMSAHEHRECCPEPPFDAGTFFKYQAISARHAQYAGTAPIQAVGAFLASLYRYFDFTNQHLVSSKIIRDYKATEWESAANKAGFEAMTVDRHAKAEAMPMSAFENALAMPAGTPFVIYEGGELSYDRLRGANQDLDSTYEIERKAQDAAAIAQRVGNELPQYARAVEQVRKQVDGFTSESAAMREELEKEIRALRRDIELLKNRAVESRKPPQDNPPVAGGVVAEPVEPRNEVRTEPAVEPEPPKSDRPRRGKKGIPR